MSDAAIPYRLDPSIDAPALAERFRRDRRVRIARLIPETQAAMLRDRLAARTDWRQVLNSGDKVFELDRATRAAMRPEQVRALDEAVAAGARAGFQYRYETIRVPDGAAARDAAAGDPLVDLARFLSGPESLALFRTITGADDIRFADAQATAYAPGDLLTGHDDGVAGKNRRAAYVLGLNPQWRIEWGGLLLHHDAPDRAEALMPGFASLDLFAVPQPHSVSAVHAAAPFRRYSVTGWLRAQPQPA